MQFRLYGTVAVVLVLLAGMAYMFNSSSQQLEGRTSPDGATAIGINPGGEASEAAPVDTESDPDASRGDLSEPAPLRVEQVPDEHLRLAGPPDLSGRYDRLAELARAGNLDAARELGVDLLSCNLYFEEIKRHDKLTRGDDIVVDAEQRAREGRALEFIESSADRASMCEGMDEERTTEWKGWISRAAMVDSASALILYQFGATQERLAELATRPTDLIRFRDESARALEAAARRCNPDAFILLAASYGSGTVTEVDPLRSAAYAVAGRRAGGLPGTGPELARLTAEDQQRAHALADGLVARACR